MDYAAIENFSFESDKKGIVLLKVMRVNYKTPDGKTDEVLFSPSTVKKSLNGIEIKPLIELH